MIYNGFNKEQLAIIKQGVPPSLISTREKGGRKYSYVEVNFVINTLNRLFGNIWSWNIISTNIHDTKIQDVKNGITKKYVSILGRLTVPMIDPTDDKKIIWVQRDAYGVHALNGADMEMRSAAFKAASSDGLKKAASTLGIAKNVYMSDDVLAALEELEDVDIWTEATKQEYINEWNEMVKFAQEHSDLAWYKKTFCDETNNYTKYMEITPSNIRAFLSWAKVRSNPDYYKDKQDVSENQGTTTVQDDQPY